MIKQQEILNKAEELFGGSAVSIYPESSEEPEENKDLPDFRLDLERSDEKNLTFIARTKKYSDVPQLASAIDRLSGHIEKNSRNIFPLIIVPYMGEVGAEFCESNDVSWMDLSGNAHIDAGNIYIHVEGKPNRFKNPGRPSNVFAPKSSRVSRYFLVNPSKFSRQKTIAEETDLSRSYVSQIVHRLEEKDLILKKDSRITVKDPEVMLEAWLEKYDFGVHEILKGTVPSKSGQETLRKISAAFEKTSVPYAATGLGAAWLYTEYANFRLCSFYLQKEPSPDLLDRISFTQTRKGHNLWLIMPKDKGVTYGSEEIKGISSVHPIQLYLDLVKGHPERAEDAARSVKEELLNWEKM